MKYCIDCTHCLDRFQQECWCRAPEAEQRRDLVTGDWPVCRDMRKESCSVLYRGKPWPPSTSRCGTEAKWFKPKGADEKTK